MIRVWTDRESGHGRTTRMLEDVLGCSQTPFLAMVVSIDAHQSDLMFKRLCKMYELRGGKITKKTFENVDFVYMTSSLGPRSYAPHIVFVDHYVLNNYTLKEVMRRVVGGKEWKLDEHDETQ